MDVEEIRILDEDLEFDRDEKDTIPRILLENFIKDYHVVDKQVDMICHDESTLVKSYELNSMDVDRPLSPYVYNGIVLAEPTLKCLFIAKCFSDKASTKIKW